MFVLQITYELSGILFSLIFSMSLFFSLADPSFLVSVCKKLDVNRRDKAPEIEFDFVEITVADYYYLGFLTRFPLNHWIYNYNLKPSQ